MSQTNNYRNVKNYRLRIKDIVLFSMGNKCQICKYDKCKAALEIHHVDPTTKEYSINEIKSWSKMCAELPKCILLCANCHREVHHNDLKIPTEYNRFDQEKANGLKIEQAELGRIISNKAVIKYNKQLAIQRKIDYQEKLKLLKEVRTNIILNSNIDFTKFGWGEQLGKCFGISRQKASAWFKKHLPDMYYSNNIKKFPRKTVV
jgi:hypothetical protein